MADAKNASGFYRDPSKRLPLNAEVILKHNWRSNSTEADDKSGVGTLEFKTGNVVIPFTEFREFNRLVGLIEREISTAYWQGGKDLRDKIACLEI